MLHIQAALPPKPPPVPSQRPPKGLTAKAIADLQKQAVSRIPGPPDAGSIALTRKRAHQQQGDQSQSDSGSSGNILTTGFQQQQRTSGASQASQDVSSAGAERCVSWLDGFK